MMGLFMVRKEATKSLPLRKDAPKKCPGKWQNDTLYSSSVNYQLPGICRSLSSLALQNRQARNHQGLSLSRKWKRNRKRLITPTSPRFGQKSDSVWPRWKCKMQCTSVVNGWVGLPRVTWDGQAFRTSTTLKSWRSGPTAFAQWPTKRPMWKECPVWHTECRMLYLLRWEVLCVHSLEIMRFYLLRKIYSI